MAAFGLWNSRSHALRRILRRCPHRGSTGFVGISKSTPTRKHLCRRRLPGPKRHAIVRISTELPLSHRSTSAQLLANSSDNVTTAALSNVSGTSAPPEYRQQIVELVRGGRTPAELAREWYGSCVRPCVEFVLAALSSAVPPPGPGWASPPGGVGAVMWGTIVGRAGCNEGQDGIRSPEGSA